MYVNAHPAVHQRRVEAYHCRPVEGKPHIEGLGLDEHRAQGVPEDLQVDEDQLEDGICPPAWPPPPTARPVDAPCPGSGGGPCGISGRASRTAPCRGWPRCPRACLAPGRRSTGCVRSRGWRARGAATRTRPRGRSPPRSAACWPRAVTGRCRWPPALPRRNALGRRPVGRTARAPRGGPSEWPCGGSRAALIVHPGVRGRGECGGVGGGGGGGAPRDARASPVGEARVSTAGF